MKTEDKNYLVDLIQRTNFPGIGTIKNVPENTQVIERNSSPNLRYKYVIFPESNNEIEIDQLSDIELSDAETID